MVFSNGRRPWTRSAASAALAALVIAWLLPTALAQPTQPQPPTGPAPTPTPSDQDATLVGCVTREGGFVRIVGPDESCRADERRIEWNVQGPTGPQGPRGATGPRGADGPPGISGLETVTAQSELSRAPRKSVTANCPQGKSALSGGFSVPEGVTVRDHIPTGTPGTGWLVNASQLDEAQSMEWVLTVYVICAYVAS